MDDYSNEHDYIVPRQAVSTKCDSTIGFYSLDSIRSRYDWLALPHNIVASPNEAVVRESFRSIAVFGHLTDNTCRTPSPCGLE